MFSRRQWWIFGGSLLVLGAGIVQNMEATAISRMNETLNDNLLNSATLSFLTFRDAAVMSKGMSRVSFAKNEPIIRLACIALTRDSIEPEVKAVAAWFLTVVLKNEDAYPLVIKHLDVSQFSSQFIKQVDEYKYTSSVAMIFEQAFNTKPPTTDREAAAEEQRAAMIASLPYQSLRLLGLIAKDQSTHAALVNEEGFVPRVLSLVAASAMEMPQGTELLYHLSLSNEGRKALLRVNCFDVIKELAFNQSLPSYTVLQEPDFHPMYLQLVATASNLYNHNLTELTAKSPDAMSAMTDSERSELKTFDYKKRLIGSEYMRFVFAFVLTSGMAGVWGALRGLVRSKMRKMVMPARSAAASGAVRAMFGAPLLVVGFLGASKVMHSANDERLLISISVVGTALSVFAARTLLLYAPFSALPALAGYWASFGGSQSQRQAQNQRLRQFQMENQQPSEDVFAKLERREQHEAKKSK